MGQGLDNDSGELNSSRKSKKAKGINHLRILNEIANKWVDKKCYSDKGRALKRFNRRWVMKPPSKLKRVTQRLMEGPLDFITAQQEVNDRSLHSTVSEIQRDYGIEVFRHRIKRPGYQGIPAACCQYQTLPDQYAKARKVLGVMKWNYLIYLRELITETPYATG